MDSSASSIDGLQRLPEVNVRDEPWRHIGTEQVSSAEKLGDAATALEPHTRARTTSAIRADGTPRSSGAPLQMAWRPCCGMCRRCWKAWVEVSWVGTIGPWRRCLKKLSCGRGSGLPPIRDEAFPVGRGLGRRSFRERRANAFHRR